MSNPTDRNLHRSNVLLQRTVRLARTFAAPTIALGLLSGCISEEDLRSAERKAELMEEKIKALESDQKLETERLVNELESLGAEKAEAQSRARQAESELQGVMENVQSLRDEFDQYKRKYRISFRKKAVGQTMEEIALSDGTVLKQVEIDQINPAGFRLKHLSGINNVAYTSLPLALQEKYMFSAEEAIAFARGTVDAEGVPTGVVEEEESATAKVSFKPHDPFADVDMSSIEAAAEEEKNQALAGRSQEEIKQRRLELRREIATLQMKAAIHSDKIKRYNSIAGRGDGEAWTSKARALAGPLKKILSDIKDAEKKIATLNSALAD